MYKKIVIALLAINLIIAALFVSQYLQNQNIKRNLLGQYVLAQHNISSNLNDAVVYQQAENNQNFIISLHKAASEFQTVDIIIESNSLLGQYTDASDLMYTIHSSQMDFIADSLDRAVNEELNNEDINRIISFEEAMEYYTDLLDYDVIIPRSSPGRIISRIDDKLDRVRHFYSSGDFDQ